MDSRNLAEDAVDFHRCTDDLPSQLFEEHIHPTASQSPIRGIRVIRGHQFSRTKEVPRISRINSRLFINFFGLIRGIRVIRGTYPFGSRVNSSYDPLRFTQPTQRSRSMKTRRAITT